MKAVKKLKNSDALSQKIRRLSTEIKRLKTENKTLVSALEESELIMSDLTRRDTVYEVISNVDAIKSKEKCPNCKVVGKIRNLKFGVHTIAICECGYKNRKKEVTES